MTVRALAVGCPRWPIVHADLEPDAPAAVFFANRVVSASPEAIACGVRKGLRRREAQSIIPEIEVLQHDPAADARAFEPIVEVVEDDDIIEAEVDEGAGGSETPSRALRQSVERGAS